MDPVAMSLTLSFLEENTVGERRSSGPFELPDSPLTLRELIRLRVQQEVERFIGALDWEKHYNKAIAAFGTHGFLVFLDDRQITSLDDSFSLDEASRVTFLKLVPLIGG